MSELIKRIVAATGVRDWQAYQMLEAIREPTPDMLETQLWTDAHHTARYVWRDMIDAALKDARDGK